MKYLILLTVFISQIASANEALKILHEMISVAKNRHYEATILMRDQEIRIMKLLHKAEDSLSKEQHKLLSLNGNFQEVVIDNNGVVFYKATNTNLPILRNPFTDTFVNIPQNLPFYQIKRLGQNRTLGRSANGFLIEAEDKWRYSYKLWTDVETNMYLRALWLDKDKIIAESMLTDLKFHTKMQPLKTNSNPKLTKSQISQLTTKGRCHVKWLPKGFKLLHHSIRQKNNSLQTEHLVFTDGVAKISVYLDFANAVNEKNHTIGRTNIVSMPFDDNNKVVVVGEVPMDTVKKIAKSVLVKFDK